MEICNQNFKCVERFQCKQEDLTKTHAELNLETHFSSSLGARVTLECKPVPSKPRKIMDIKCTESGWRQTNGKELETCELLECTVDQDCGRLGKCDTETQKCLEACKNVTGDAETDIADCCKAIENAPERCINDLCLTSASKSGSNSDPDKSLSRECLPFVDKISSCQDKKDDELAGQIKETKCPKGFQCHKDMFCYPSKYCSVDKMKMRPGQRFEIQPSKNKLYFIKFRSWKYYLCKSKVIIEQFYRDNRGRPV